MKKVKSFIKGLCEHAFFNIPLLALSKLFSLKNFEERILKIRAEQKYFKASYYNKTVLRGPFKGLVYPDLKATGSEMAPKILGSYESELFQAIEEICNRQYDSILDIGCAEGYYAVGLALRFRQTPVFAFDVDDHALKLCTALAETNHVRDQVHLKGFCSAETLRDFSFGARGLIICDCEGYEAELFNKENIPNLKNTDLLIELHDTLTNPISPMLLPLFKETHDLEIIKTQKKEPGQYPELSRFSVTEQKIILSECRGTLLGEPSMEWAYLVAKEGSLKSQNPEPHTAVAG